MKGKFLEAKKSTDDSPFGKHSVVVTVRQLKGLQEIEEIDKSFWDYEDTKKVFDIYPEAFI